MEGKEKIQGIIRKMLTEVSSLEELSQVEIDFQTLYELLAKKRIEEYLVDFDMSDHEKKIEIYSVIESLKFSSNISKRAINKMLDYNLLGYFSARNFKKILNFLKEDSSKLEKVRLITAIKFNQKDILEFKSKLENIYGESLVIIPQVNKSIKGGFILRKGSQIIDFTVQTSLEKYRQRWLKNLIG